MRPQEWGRSSLKVCATTSGNRPDERIPHRHASVPLPVGQIFPPKNAAAQFDGAVDHQRVPPGHLVTALETRGSQQIRMARTVNDPTAQVGQNLFGFLAGDSEFFRGGGVELRETSAQRDIAAAMRSS
jgi:hypothetical protein